MYFWHLPRHVFLTFAFLCINFLLYFLIKPAISYLFLLSPIFSNDFLLFLSVLTLQSYLKELFHDLKNSRTRFLKIPFPSRSLTFNQVSCVKTSAKTKNSPNFQETSVLAFPFSKSTVPKNK